MPPQNLLFALCYLHIVLLIYWDKESYVPKGLQFAKNSDNFCVTTHSSYMLTRHPLSTSETINENGKKKKPLLPASCGKTDTESARACDFSNSIQSSSNKLIIILQRKRVESSVCWGIPDPDVQDAEHLLCSLAHTLWDFQYSDVPSTFLI